MEMLNAIGLDRYNPDAHDDHDHYPESCTCQDCEEARMDARGGYNDDGSPNWRWLADHDMIDGDGYIRHDRSCDCTLCNDARLAEFLGMPSVAAMNARYGWR